MEKIYWATLTHQEWPIILAATEKGLCFVGSLKSDLGELKKWQLKRLPNANLEENAKKMSPYLESFCRYFNEGQANISCPLDLYGTAFQQKVWAALADIPFGQTSTYGEIANCIQQPKAVRAVGGAIGANPVAIVIPCHRVIGKDGSLTGFRGGLEMKKRLLKIERIAF